MSEPTQWTHDAVESIAVPVWDLVDDIVVAIGEAGAALLLPHKPVEPSRPGALVRRSRPPVPPDQPRRPVPSTELLIYPPIGRDAPWGASPASPMGEGSEDTAVPPVDPAELRLREELPEERPEELPEELPDERPEERREQREGGS